MSDLIRRQAAIDEIVTWLKDRMTDGKNGKPLTDRIKDLPPTQTEQRWIPCDETVDIPEHETLACDKYGELMFGFLAYEDEQWLCESEGCMMYDPIAWSEKPDPYKPERRIMDDQ